MLETKPPSPEYTDLRFTELPPTPQADNVLKKGVIVNVRHFAVEIDQYLAAVNQADRTREAFTKFY